MDDAEIDERMECDLARMRRVSEPPGDRMYRLLTEVEARAERAHRRANETVEIKRFEWLATRSSPGPGARRVGLARTTVRAEWRPQLVVVDADG